MTRDREGDGEGREGDGGEREGVGGASPHVDACPDKTVDELSLQHMANSTETESGLSPAGLFSFLLSEERIFFPSRKASSLVTSGFL